MSRQSVLNVSVGISVSSTTVVVQVSYDTYSLSLAFSAVSGSHLPGNKDTSVVQRTRIE